MFIPIVLLTGRYDTCLFPLVFLTGRYDTCLFPFSLYTICHIVRAERNSKMKKEIGQVQEKKRKEIVTTIYYHLNHCLCHNISIFIVRSTTFLQKNNDI